MKRLFLGGPLADEVSVDGPLFHHAFRVLRLGMGDAVRVTGSDGCEAAATVVSIGEGAARLRLTGIVVCPPLRFRLTLACGLLKGERFDWLVQKATELGAHSLWPLAMDRCIVKAEGREERKTARWERIAREAAQQCGRQDVPGIPAPQTLAQAIAAWAGRGHLVVPHEACGGGALPADAPADMLCVIGPEGGISPAETARLDAAGASFVTLGPRILRAETAALAATVLLMGTYGDMGGDIGCRPSDA